MARSLSTILATIILGSLFTANQTWAAPNDWISYDQPYFRIKVVEKGVYRIPYSTLAKTGLDTVSPQHFAIYHMGKPVSIFVGDNQGAAVNSLDNNDYIEFYGHTQQGYFDSLLYKNNQWQPQPYQSMFTDTAIYYLTFSPGSPDEYISLIPNDTTSPPPRENYFWHTSRHILQNGFHKPPRQPNGPTYLSSYEEGEGRVSKKWTNTTKTVNLNTPYKHNTPQGTLTTSITGREAGNHNANITVGGVQYFSQSLQDHEIKHLSNSNINNGDISSTTSVSYNINGSISLAAVSLTYPRVFNFNNASLFPFTLQGTGDKYITVQNFNNQGKRPWLIDRINQIKLQGTLSGPYNFILPDSTNNTSRKCVLSSSFDTIRSLPKVNFRNLKQTDGDYIIITSPSLRSAAREYQSYRYTKAGGDYQVVLVNIEQLYDQFAYGIQKHPLAIRHFVDYVLREWTTRPQHLFLIGLGLPYSQKCFDCQDKWMKNPSYANFCQVPTFGWPGSDNLLTATQQDYRPRIPVGRLAASTPGQVQNYLDKVRNHESHQKWGNPNQQMIDKKAWMKRILHFGGGNNQSQQDQFQSYLSQYKEIIEGPYYGGDVISFFKTSSDPIQIIATDYIDSLLTNGVSLMTFFGHSSSGSFDFSVDNPQNYPSNDKYPFLLSNGCYSGNIHTTNGDNLSKRFIFASNKGAIGFLAMSFLSYSGSDHKFSKNFYQNLGQDNYHTTVGKVIQSTIEDIYGPSSLTAMTSHQFTLHGDPALQLNTHPLPDYAINRSQISFQPSVLSVGLDSFTININITNLGKALDTTFRIRVQREFSDFNPQQTEAYTKTVQAPYYERTVSMTLPMSPAQGGENHFTIEIDWLANTSEGQVKETEENFNNEVGPITKKINSKAAIPIHPYPYSIVPDKQITLKASTINLFAPSRTYLIQIDTTQLFNSPLLQNHKVRQKGGLITWTPSVQWKDSTVYYWRISPNPTNQQPTLWKSSSFIYLKEGLTGWSQSHRFQYESMEMENIFLPDTPSARTFRFVNTIKDISARNFNALHPQHHKQEIAWSMNLARQHVSQLNDGDCCPDGGGLMYVVIDSATGLPWKSVRCDCPWKDGTYGEKHCADPQEALKAFDFCDGINGTVKWTQRQADFIDTIPAGNYVLVMGIGVGTKSKAGHYLNDYPNNVKNKLQGLGMTNIDSINNRYPFIFFNQKPPAPGKPGWPIQKVGDSVWDVLELNTQVEGNWSEGVIRSPLIGPARSWQSLHWSTHSLENTFREKAELTVIGITPQGEKTVLLSDVQQPHRNLSTINPKKYPYLQLQLYTKDDSFRTPSQLDFWRVYYRPLPEAVLAPKLQYSFLNNTTYPSASPDTLHHGQQARASISLKNITPYPMDSMLIHYKTWQKSQSKHIPYPRQDSLRAGEQWVTRHHFNTFQYAFPEMNELEIDVNPDNDQPEQYHFNNVAQIPFHVRADQQNPLLDVTFDGRHVLDGDIVSPHPDILIQLDDENQYLPLNDTSLLKIWIRKPNQQQPKRIWFRNPNVHFNKPRGNNKNNTAKIRMQPHFEQSGEYELLVQGKDRSQNKSPLDYSVRFKVIQESSITNVLNYPNPFSTSTRFVFTLTGSRIPTTFKIQIMSITGKIVREIHKNELGELHIGRNITDFAWNGTDQYGDPLANGVYLYRVVAKIDGRDIKHRQTKADPYFESGYGKMYLMR